MVPTESEYDLSARVAAAGSGSGAASSAAGTTAESGAAASAMAAASLDMVDALRRHVADECVQLAAIQHSLVVSRFIANPDAAELSPLPRLDAAGVTTLDVSYCLELRSPPLLLHALRTLPALTALDLTACDLLCEGAACVAAALGGSVRGAQPALASLSLRANRIGELGAAALGAGIARCTSLLRLDLSANPLGDDGLIRLICGEPKPKADEEYGNAEGGAQGEGGGRGVASGLALLRAAATLDGSEDGHSGGDGRAEGGEVRSRRSKQSAKRSADESGGGGDGLPSGLRHSSSLEALLLSKVGIGSRSVPAVGALVVELDTLRELDLSVNSCSGVDEWAAQSEPRLTGEDGEETGSAKPMGGAVLTAAVAAAAAAAASSASATSSDAAAAGSTASGAPAGSSGFGRLGRRGGKARPGAPSAVAQLAAHRESLDALALSCVTRSSGSSDADWLFPASMRSLGRVLGSRPQLTKLAIQHCSARARVGACVASASHATASVAQLRHLNLQGSILSEAAFAELCKALRARGARGPTHLNLEGCVRKAHESLPSLWSLLRAPDSPIASLNLGFNALRQHGGELGQALAANNGALKELDIGSNELGGEYVAVGIIALCDSFSPAAASRSSAAGASARASARVAAAPSAAPTPAVPATSLRAEGTCRLQSLDLSYIPLGVAGASRLAALLRLRGCRLTSLRLDGCSLGADGTAALAAALGEPARCAPIATLRLEYNSMGVDGMAALAHALPSRPSLTALFVGCNGLGEHGTRHLALAMSVSPNLRTLDCGDNDLDDRALRALLEGVRSQYALTALDLSNNRLGDSGAEIVANELRANHALQFVRCAGNAIGPTGGRSLARPSARAPTTRCSSTPSTTRRSSTATRRHPTLQLPKGARRRRQPARRMGQAEE